MGVDLKLLVVDGDLGDWGYAHTMLECNKNYSLHKAIEEQKPFVRENFIFYSYVSDIPDGELEGGRCYGKVEETPYGKPITYLKVKNLEAAFKQASEDMSIYNRAIMSFISALPKDMCVALYWH